MGLALSYTSMPGTYCEHFKHSWDTVFMLDRVYYSGNLRNFSSSEQGEPFWNQGRI